MPRRQLVQYATLLRIRSRQEDLRAQALAAARRDVQLARRKRDLIDRQQSQALDDARGIARKVFDASEVRVYYQYERHLQRLADETDANIEYLCIIEEQRRQELEDAMKRRKIIEKLLERKTEAFRSEMRLAEQKAADEAAANYAAITRRSLNQESMSIEESR